MATQTQTGSPAATQSPETEAPKTETPLLDQAVQRAGSIILTEHGVEFGDFDGLWRWCTMIFHSGMAPKGMNVSALCVAAVMGRNVGIDPFNAIQNIAVINNRPSMFGDMPLAVCRQHELWEESGFKEEITGEGDKMVARCWTLRKGASAPVMREFSVADARQAKLWGKEGPWTFYPKRMLMFRARGYCLRDNFGDALKGLGIKELVEGDEIGESQRPELPVGRVSTKAMNGSKANPVAETAVPAVPEPKAAEPKVAEPQSTPPTEEAREDLSKKFHRQIMSSLPLQLQDVKREILSRKDELGDERTDDLMAVIEERIVMAS